MKPVIDISKEYGIVLDGGGARGAYQIGAWKALEKAGIKIKAVAGTSVGALNGALICMGDVDKAEHIWKEMAFSKVMDVDDDWMERLFSNEITIREFLKELWERMKEGGIDVTPLKNLIHEVIDEDKIRNAGIDFSLLTFSLSDMKELDLTLDQIPEGLLEDFLLASAYLLGFKNEPLHGKTYLDGGVINNVPLNSLVKRGYKDIITVRIYGPGREPKVKLDEETTVYEIAPRVQLGSILEFHQKRSVQNMKIGYYDAMRVIYGLKGLIYYIHSEQTEEAYEELLKDIWEKEKREIKFMLKLPLGATDEILYLSMLEASAKYFKIPKYQIYEENQLLDFVYKKYMETEEESELPKFIYVLVRIIRKQRINLKGNSFLTLKDRTPDEIKYLIHLAVELKEKKEKGIREDLMKGKRIGMIFETPSMKMQAAFMIAAQEEGAIPIYLYGNEIQSGCPEIIEETAGVLGKMFDGIVFYGGSHVHAELVAKYSHIPVWNAMTDACCPIEILADLLTIRENFGYLEGLKIVCIEKEQDSMPNGIITGCVKAGMDVTVITPKKPESEGFMVTENEKVEEDADVIYNGTRLYEPENLVYVAKAIMLSAFQEVKLTEE